MEHITTVGRALDYMSQPPTESIRLCTVRTQKLYSPLEGAVPPSSPLKDKLEHLEAEGSLPGVRSS